MEALKIKVAVLSAHSWPSMDYAYTRVSYIMLRPDKIAYKDPVSIIWPLFIHSFCPFWLSRYSFSFLSYVILMPFNTRV